MCGIGKSSGAWLVRFPAQLGHLARTTLAMPYLTRLTARICILFGCLSQYRLATQGWCLVDSTCTSNFRKAHANFVWSRKNGHGCARVASLQPSSMETKSHRVNPQLGPQTPVQETPGNQTYSAWDGAGWCVSRVPITPKMYPWELL
jgi:hypothetical protein